MYCWHIFTQICYQLTKDPDCGYPSDYLTNPNDPVEQREREILSLPPLALAEDQDIIIIQVLKGFRNGHDSLRPPPPPPRKAGPVTLALYSMDIVIF